MEASHKKNICQWTTIDHGNYCMQTNGGQVLDGVKAFEIGNYNALLKGCPEYEKCEFTTITRSLIHEISTRCTTNSRLFVSDLSQSVVTNLTVIRLCECHKFFVFPISTRVDKTVLTYFTC